MFVLLALCILCGVVAFLIFGLPAIIKISERAGNLYAPSDDAMRIIPEYSIAEARAKEGKYAEAVDEYHKVLVEHPDDIYAHFRIAELAVVHLRDPQLAEVELLSAVAKAEGKNTVALAAGRLADLYQFTLQDPARALAVMKQLREKVSDTQQATRADERIAALESLLGGAAPAKLPDKIAIRRSRYKMPE